MALCKITGTVYLPSGLLARSRPIVFRRASRVIGAEYLGVVLPDDVAAQTNSAGEIDVDLLTGEYVVFADQYSARANVPDAATADFSDIVGAGAVPPSPPVWYQQALAARDDAALSAAEASADRIQAQAAAAAVPAQVADVRRAFVRRNYVDRSTFDTGLGAWISQSTGRLTIGASGGVMVMNGIAGQTGFVTVLEPGFKEIEGDVAFITASATLRALTAGPTFRFQWQYSNDGVSVAAQGSSPYVPIPTDEGVIRADIPVSGYRFILVRANVDQYADRTIHMRQFSAVAEAVDRAFASARQTRSVGWRSQFSQIGLQGAERVLDRATGLSYIPDPAVDANLAAATLGDGTKLIPASDVNATVLHFDARPDYDAAAQAGTDCTASLKRAIDWTTLRGRDLHIPAGDYFRTSGGQSMNINPNGRSVRIFGEGKAQSRIFFRDDAYLADNNIEDAGHFMLFQGSGTDLMVKDLSVIGRWTGARFVEETNAQGAPVLRMKTYGGFMRGSAFFSREFVMENVHVEGFAALAISIRGGDLLRARDVSFEKCQRGGFNCQNWRNSYFTGISGRYIFDDVINVPAKPTGPFGNELLGVQRERSVRITDFLVENGQGIGIGGAMQATLNNIVGKNVMTRLIAFLEFPPAIGSSISNVSCTNLFNQRAIAVTTSDATLRAVGGGNLNAIHIRPAPLPATKNPPKAHFEWGPDGQGGVVSPYMTRGLADDANGQLSMAPIWAFTVSNVNIVQGVKAGQKWQDFNSELPFWTRFGPANDLVFTEGMLDADGVHIDGPCYDTLISDAHFVGVQRPITLNASQIENADTYYAGGRPQVDFRRVRIEGSSFTDYHLQAIDLYGRGTVNVDSCSFDGDPLHLDASRGEAGVWTADTARPAIRVQDGAGFSLSNSRFRNMARISAGTPTFESYRDNVAFGDFVGLSDPANKGIRNLQVHPNRFGMLAIEGCDPADAETFQRIQRSLDPKRAAVPTTGWWLAGTMIDLTQPIDDPAGIITGYLRRTTGTGNVLGADWALIRNGAPVGYTIINTDAIRNVLFGTDGPTIFDETTLTANRFRTLMNNGTQRIGSVLRMVRTGGGGFDLIVRNEALAELTRLRQGEWADLAWTGTEWRLAGFGNRARPADPDPLGITTFNNDSSTTWAYGSVGPTVIDETVLTADRQRNLTAAGPLKNGSRMRIVRTGAGAFSLNVRNAPTSTTLKLLAQNQWMDAEWSGTEWRLVGFGSL